MIRRFPKVIALILSLIMILSICGVSATWILSDGSAVQSQSLDLTADLGEFIYDIDSLIEAIIKEMNDVDSDINKNLRARFDGNILGWGTHSYYGSMDPNHDNSGVAQLLEKYGSDMSFVVSAEISNYSTQQYTYTTAYIYTCDVNLGESGTSDAGLLYENTSAGNPTIPIGENIYRVYKTKITRMGTSANNMSDWEREETTLGYAPSCWYCENRSLSPIATQIPSYDISNWEEGNLGYSMDTAVYTFKGDTPSAYNDEYDDNADREITYYTDTQNSSGSFYFVLETTGNTYYYAYNQGYTYYLTSKPSSFNFTYLLYGGTSVYSYNSTGDYTITADSTDVTITILNSSGTTLATSTGGSVTFNAGSTKTKYYIKVDSGGQTAHLTVTYDG